MTHPDNLIARDAEFIGNRRVRLPLGIKAQEGFAKRLQPLMPSLAHQ